jgi:hypothetical protein
MDHSQSEDIRRGIMICDACGFPGIAELINHYLFRKRCPGICQTCGYIEDLECGEMAGCCPVCDTWTMRSALVLR